MAAGSPIGLLLALTGGVAVVVTYTPITGTVFGGNTGSTVVSGTNLAEITTSATLGTITSTQTGTNI